MIGRKVWVLNETESINIMYGHNLFVFFVWNEK